MQVVGFPDAIDGSCTTPTLHTISRPAGRQACSRLDDIAPLRPDSFTYACDASGITALSAEFRHRHSRWPFSFRHRSSPAAPFLDRHYPASSVLRASPPPRPARPAPHGARLVRATPPTGLPVLLRSPSYMHAIATTPAGPLGARVVYLPQRRRPSPNLSRVGSCITLLEACSAFTARYGLRVRQVPYGPATLEASAASLPPRPFQLLPAGTTVAGWESHPLRERAFPRHTEKSGLALAYSLLTAFAGFVADPAQRHLGTHERRLRRLLAAIDRNLRGDGPDNFAVRDHHVARILDVADPPIADLPQVALSKFH